MENLIIMVVICLGVVIGILIARSDPYSEQESDRAVLFRSVTSLISEPMKSVRGFILGVATLYSLAWRNMRGPPDEE